MWVVRTTEDPGGSITEALCCKSDSNSCSNARFVYSEKFRSGGPDLKPATSELNDVLSRLKEENKDPRLELVVVNVGDNVALAWVRSGGVTFHDDQRTLEESLSLQE